MEEKDVPRIGKTGEVLENREEYYGEHKVRIAAWQPAFGLIDLYLKDKKVVLQELHTAEDIHSYLWELTRDKDGSQRPFKIQENNFIVTLIKLDDRWLDSGPNHIGIEVRKMKQDVSSIISSKINKTKETVNSGKVEIKERTKNWFLRFLLKLANKIK